MIYRNNILHLPYIHQLYIIYIYIAGQYIYRSKHRSSDDHITQRRHTYTGPGYRLDITRHIQTYTKSCTNQLWLKLRDQQIRTTWAQTWHSTLPCRWPTRQQVQTKEQNCNMSSCSNSRTLACCHSKILEHQLGAHMVAAREHVTAL